MKTTGKIGQTEEGLVEDQGSRLEIPMPLDKHKLVPKTYFPYDEVIVEDDGSTNRVEGATN